jgi:hypothetical protein
MSFKRFEILMDFSFVPHHLLRANLLPQPEGHLKKRASLGSGRVWPLLHEKGEVLAVMCGISAALAAAPDSDKIETRKKTSTAHILDGSVTTHCSYDKANLHVARRF